MNILNRHRKLKSKHKLYFAKGFTIIELMIAVAILGVVVAFAAPSFSDFIQRQTVNSETQKLAAVFKMARIEALSRTSIIDVVWNVNAIGGANVVLNVGGETATIVPGNIVVADFASNTPDDGGAGGVEILHDASYRHARLSVVENDGDNRMRFTAQGRTTEGGIITIGVCKSAGDDDDSSSVQIQPLGRISVLDNDNDGGNGNQIAC